MSEHSVFPIEKEKTVKEFQELVQKYLDNPKEIGLHAFSKKACWNYGNTCFYNAD